MRSRQKQPEKQAWPGIRVCPSSLLFTLEEIFFEIFLKIKKITKFEQIVRFNKILNKKDT